MVEKYDKKCDVEKPVAQKIVKTVSLRCKHLSVPDVSQTAGSIIVAVIASLSFAGSLKGDFVFDDNEAILNNKDVRMETKLFSLFKHDFWGENITSATSHKSYRPLTVVTFRLNYWAAGGYEAVGFHVINLLLHAFNCVLSLRVFSVIFGGILVSLQGKKAFASPRASLLAAILFATHPIHTENVRITTFAFIGTCFFDDKLSLSILWISINTFLLTQSFNVPNFLSYLEDISTFSYFLLISHRR